MVRGHENVTGLGLLGADRQFPWPRLDRAHSFDRVQDQVQHDLLQLNTISLNGSQPLRQAGSDRNSFVVTTLRANEITSLITPH